MIGLGKLTDNLIVLEVYYNINGNFVFKTYPANKNSSMELYLNEALYEISNHLPNVIYSIDINIPDRYIVLNI